MGRASDVLIPARFLLTMGHFVVVVLAFYHRVRVLPYNLGRLPA
jgi:hypothetical protein